MAEARNLSRLWVSFVSDDFWVWRSRSIWRTKNNVLRPWRICAWHVLKMNFSVVWNAWGWSSQQSVDSGCNLIWQGKTINHVDLKMQSRRRCQQRKGVHSDSIRCISYWLDAPPLRNCEVLLKGVVDWKLTFCGRQQVRCMTPIILSSLATLFPNPESLYLDILVGHATRLLGFAESTDTVRDTVQLISSQEFVLGRRISIEWFAPSARSHQGWRCWTAREKLEISWELMRQRTHLDWSFQYHFYFDCLYCECIAFCSHFKYNKASL